MTCNYQDKLIIFFTSKGKFEVELFGSSSPLTVSNFIQNINNKIYKDISFYKIINYPNTKIIHGGLFSKNNSEKIENKNINYLNNIPLELKFNDKKEPIYNFQINDPIKKDNLKNKFERGSLAMVKSGKNNSSSTEFFFSLSKSPELDGRYSIFGRVTKGYEILESLKENDSLEKIEISY